MSLYNMLMGQNPFCPMLLAAIGITEETNDMYPLGRVRDLYTNDAADKVFILTRNYGEAWIPIDEALAKHPMFIQKTTAAGDSTYTIYEFSVPEATKEMVQKIAEVSDNTPAMERYLQAINDFASGVDNAQTQHMTEVGKQIAEKMMESFEKGEDATITNEFGSVEIISGGKNEDIVQGP